MCDFVLATETRHLLAGKVRSFVRNNGVGESKAAYYILLQKLDNLFPGDFEEQFCLDPFGEVVSGYEEES